MHSYVYSVYFSCQMKYQHNLLCYLLQTDLTKEIKSAFILEGQGPHRQLYQHSHYDISDVSSKYSSRISSSPFCCILSLQYVVVKNTNTQWDTPRKKKKEKKRKGTKTGDKGKSVKHLTKSTAHTFHYY